MRQIKISGRHVKGDMVMSIITRFVSLVKIYYVYNN